LNDFWHVPTFRVGKQEGKPKNSKIFQKQGGERIRVERGEAERKLVFLSVRNWQMPLKVLSGMWGLED